MSNYPTKTELATVKKWEFAKPGSFKAFMEYVKSIGNYWRTESFGWRHRGRTYWVSTGGWSGNEDILDAMQSNRMFWMVCWVSHRRGGHFVFQIPNDATFYKAKPQKL